MSCMVRAVVQFMSAVLEMLFGDVTRGRFSLIYLKKKQSSTQTVMNPQKSLQYA